MNKNQQVTVNSNIRSYFSLISKRHIAPSFAMNTGNTVYHETVKFLLAYNLSKESHTVMSEGHLRNGKRPDIVLLDVPGMQVIEVMDSESMVSIREKVSYYNATMSRVKITPKIRRLIDQLLKEIQIVEVV